MTIPIDAYSTQAARAEEIRRRKLRRELLADVKRAVDALTTESVAAIKAISPEEWAAAQKEDEDTNAA